MTEQKTLMVDTVTQAGTHNGGLSNVLEIERLIIQKQLVMNQSAILLQRFFSGTLFFFLLQPVGSDLSGGHLGMIFFFSFFFYSPACCN